MSGALRAPARGRLRQPRGDSAREALLGAAERVFARAGFNGATTAAIAEAAGVPKANLHYHFGSKHELYHEVLARTLHDWLVPMDSLVAEAEPRTALAAYIRAKMAMSAERPDASRVFANELLHGAPVLGELMRTELRAMVQKKARSSKAGSQPAAWRRSMPLIFSSPSGRRRRRMLISTCRCALCLAARA